MSRRLCVHPTSSYFILLYLARTKLGTKICTSNTMDDWFYSARSKEIEPGFPEVCGLLCTGVVAFVVVGSTLVLWDTLVSIWSTLVFTTHNMESTRDSGANLCLQQMLYAGFVMCVNENPLMLSKKWLETEKKI